LEKIYKNLDLNKWIWIVTADHGNADKMIDHGESYTAHTLNNVPFIIITNLNTKIFLKKGKLGNIAPTIIDLINRKGFSLEKPKEMTCESLIKN
jgi:2,3-bisphosphoglycerate-independent phosphoglycerate mutase